MVSAALLTVALVGCGQTGPSEEPAQGEQPTVVTISEEPADPSAEPSEAPTGDVDLVPRAFDEYSWDELAGIARLIEAAGSVDEGRAIAAEYGLIEADGTITTQTRTISLANGVECDVRVVGILHDELADGSGLAGITFATGAIDVQPMNGSAVAAGGWEACELRSWLASDGLALFPQDLAGLIVPVSKATNNVGVTNTSDSVTLTSDALWLFSPREVCGEIDWFADEFGGGFAYMDSVLNAEGQQYEAFAQAGVAASTDPNHVLATTIGGQKCPWWYRSPYPLNANDTSDPGVFYQVMSSGYPSSVGQADVAVGVVVGFCL